MSENREFAAGDLVVPADAFRWDSSRKRWAEGIGVGVVSAVAVDDDNDNVEVKWATATANYRASELRPCPPVFDVAMMRQVWRLAQCAVHEVIRMPVAAPAEHQECGRVWVNSGVEERAFYAEWVEVNRWFFVRRSADYPRSGWVGECGRMVTRHHAEEMRVWRAIANQCDRPDMKRWTRGLRDLRAERGVISDERICAYYAHIALRAGLFELAIMFRVELNKFAGRFNESLSENSGSGRSSAV